MKKAANPLEEDVAEMTYPVITEIHFTDAAPTRAAAKVTIGYSGATVELEKEGGRWIARRLTNQWIT